MRQKKKKRRFCWCFACWSPMTIFNLCFIFFGVATQAQNWGLDSLFACLHRWHWMYTEDLFLAKLLRILNLQFILFIKKSEEFHSNFLSNLSIYCLFIHSLFRLFSFVLFYHKLSFNANFDTQKYSSFLNTLTASFYINACLPHCCLFIHLFNPFHLIPFLNHRFRQDFFAFSIIWCLKSFASKNCTILLNNES